MVFLNINHYKHYEIQYRKTLNTQNSNLIINSFRPNYIFFFSEIMFQILSHLFNFS